jgi:hypothetical protein
VAAKSAQELSRPSGRTAHQALRGLCQGNGSFLR